MWNDVRALNAISSILLGIVLLVLCASGVWWVIHRPVFTLKAVTVNGVSQVPLERVNALTVRSGAMPYVKGNFFTAELDEIRDGFETVPWVRKAMVRREWPDRLIVSLEEHHALGTWGEGKLLSTNGEVFVANMAEAEEGTKLLEFEGPEGSEKEVFARYLAFKSWFAPLGIAPESVTLTGRYAWTLRMNTGMVVELGREQHDSSLKERVDRLISVYPQLMEKLNGRINHVDMRYTNGLALKADGIMLTSLNGKK